MKKIILLCVLIMGLFPVTVFAHTLKTDGSIGAVLHVDPADDPEIGKPATFFFEFKDKQNKFSLHTCECRAQILKGDTEVYAGSLSGAGGLNSPLFQYTFTEKGIYTVIVVGLPRVPGDFQNFTLSWDIRVEKGGGNATAAPNQADSGGHTLHVILLGGALAVVVGKYLLDARKRKGTLKQSSRHIAASVVTILALFGFMFHEVHAAGGHHVGETQPVPHECCMPVFGDTAVVVEKVIISVAVRANATHEYVVLFDSWHGINNKSPPIA